jgi:hypothetical protein
MRNHLERRVEFDHAPGVRLSHASAVMGERYAHLKQERFTPKDMAVIDLDLAAGDAVPVPLGQSLGRTSAALGSK